MSHERDAEVSPTLTRNVCNGINGSPGGPGSPGANGRLGGEVEVEPELSSHHEKCTNATIANWVDTTAYFSAPCTSAIFRYCKAHEFKRVPGSRNAEREEPGHAA